MQVFRTVTLPALLPTVVGAATVVFLFCSTAFGIVLTLGGLRYANVETEIWLLTTQELDLTGAAALSVLQLVVITGLLVLTHVTRKDAGPVDRAAGTARRPRRGDALAARLVGLGAGRPGAADAGPADPLADRPGRAAGRSPTTAPWRVRRAARCRCSALTGLANSLEIALVATGFALILGVIVAGLVSRRPARASGRRAASPCSMGYSCCRSASRR